MIGFVNVYKPRGVTSFSIVSRIKKIFNTKRVGHLGTLDPMAEGVLPIAIGKATKLFDYFLDKDKRYIAEFECGYETDTLDAFGEVVERNSKVPSLEEIEKATKNFIGKIEQIPPKFSAKKINGERAYNLAKQKIDFDISAKSVEIYTILASKGLSDSLFVFDVWCRAGTYIRSLGRDIFRSVNSLATMTKLTRTSSGSFTLNGCSSLEDIEKAPQEYLLPVEKCLPELDILQVTDKEMQKLLNGVQVTFNAYNVIKNECSKGIEETNRKPDSKSMIIVKHGIELLGIAEIQDKIKLNINLYME